MIEGLWVKQHDDMMGTEGGVVVLVNGQVLGGDNTFVYTGTYRTEGTDIWARILVRQCEPLKSDVLAFGRDFEVIVDGTISGEVIKGRMSLLSDEDTSVPVRLIRASTLEREA